MPAQQTAPRSPALRRYGRPAALSALGSLIILAVLYQTAGQAPVPSPSPTPVLTMRRVAMAARALGPEPRDDTPSRRLASARGPRSSVQPTVVELPESPTPAEVPTAAPTLTPPRSEVIVYQVQPGDNLFSISQRFDLSQDTLAWANEAVEEHPDQLTIGQELYVLPVEGVWHTVQVGETLAAIAQRYGVEAQAIADYPGNAVAIAGDGSLAGGQKLIVPGGSKPRKVRPTAAPAPAPAGGPRLRIPAGAPEVPVEAPAQPGRFIWPAQGIITQGYGSWHGAIDIANKQGTPILAADAGTVTFAGPSGGLGNAIQIDHGDGFATAYAHLHSISVQVGQGVQQGEQIGLMGTTGHSTGPHLHLIVTYNGGIVNPLHYLQ